MFEFRTVALASVSLAAVLAPSTSAHAENLVNPVTGGHEHWCDTPQVRATNYQAPTTPFAAGARVIWLNRMGGAFTKGSNTNSNTNVIGSWVNLPSSFTIPPMSSAFDWPLLVACVKEKYKPYNVRFVESKPTSGNYLQAVIGGSVEDVGREQGLLGTAAADNFCGVTENGIGFVFAESHLSVGRPQDYLCVSVSHEIGHLLSLEHEILSPDIMSYSPVTSNGKTFVNQESQCGVTASQTNACSCPITSSPNNTNSGKRLLSALGARPTETIAPTITLDAPAANAELTPTFTVTATATDNVAIETVALLVNNFERGVDDMAETGNKYSISLKDVAEGEHEIVMVATDTSGNITKTAPIKVTVAKRATGGDCAANSDCTGGICADDGTQKFCTEACTIDNDACPGGFDCISLGASNICNFAADEGGGCCDAGNSSGSAAMFGAFMVGLVLLRKRRHG